ncbi:enoyl-[acyl-carrier protein] reductase / trans-2-enoyl-CoA reductase (NAD+) [Anaerosporobacter mobilis DSM 15930]|uniref:Trans-2-enoyl-CoA reductase [NADH] n=1 Tax=Anaerosporobacter mobilis DSM 15930 TaxID=1120996 RepID=A0A1M7LC75_9FIRM|nr:enoyl-ACP reductase FabV [Anaerosporobacter mobilis]SHM75180.1 enoyl-[acyl-carrier protein] reductase / trans-2-enoyl-CoA reductase (NAD+) [Anaerosporobacter mobilis DSM 15930]
MIIEPKVRGFICTTAHPTGCRVNVANQIAYAKVQQKKLSSHSAISPKKALIIGSSTGYGLATRISLAYTYQASTIGVMYEKEASGNRTATAGWYNTAAFESFAANDGLYAQTINGDAFSREIKDETIAKIKRDLGKVDMVIYSLAAPRRTMADGTVFSSVLKATTDTFVSKSLDLRHNTIEEASIPTATEEEIESTIKVMGGEDWAEWIDALVAADAIEGNAITVAYSYIGPELTYPIYKEGTIGHAKEHLHKTANLITKEYQQRGIHAYISVNKALVTQASAAIPVVPLYISLLYKVQKELGTHEGCIEQINRMFTEKLLIEKPDVDKNGYLRLDDYELDSKVQEQINATWDKVTTDNLKDLADIDGYWDDFYTMFGFKLSGVNYTEEVDTAMSIPSISSTSL